VRSVEIRAPWATLGYDISEFRSAADMLVAAGLDWRVEPRPVYDARGVEIPRYRGNFRVDTGECLGIPTGRYRIVQNEELFVLAEGLLAESCIVRRAGSSDQGRMVWVVVESVALYQVAGETLRLELDLSNHHTGLNSFQVRLTPILPSGAGIPIRARTRERTIYFRHTLNVANRVSTARMALGQGDLYMAGMRRLAERLSGKADWSALLASWIPEDKRANRRTEQVREYIAGGGSVEAWRDTGWGFLAAAAEGIAQLGAARDTARSEERRLEVWMEGHEMLGKAFEVVQKAAQAAS